MTTRRVALLGGSGLMGRRLAAVLAERGHQVVAVSRRSGVDVRTGSGLAEALSGAHTVVDCLNITTMRRRPAETFFRTTAGQVCRAARTAQVGHLVCLSIVNAADPAVSSAMGYYAGKAAQEQVYARSGLPVTIARTTQWYELAATMLDRFRLGGWAVVPSMLIQPVAAVAAAEFLADLVEQGRGAGEVAHLAGPHQHDLAELARRIADQRAPGTRVLAAPILPARLRTGALLPRGSVRLDPRTFAEWLSAEW